VKLLPLEHVRVCEGAVDVSLIVNVSLATIVPLVLPVRILIVPVSAPSVVESAVGVAVNEPAFELMLKLPDDVLKSPAGSTDQYNVVLSATFVVVTFMVPATPSSIEAGAVTA
jgi:hypothetical protein